MIEEIGHWIDAVLQWTAEIPLTLWAIIAGVVTGAALTQWLKRTIPVTELFPGMSKGMQVLYVRTIALVFSFLPTFFIWPGQHAVWVALAVGVTTPALYRSFTFMLYRRWPDLERSLSGTE